MYFSTVVVDNCNSYGVALMDSNDGPLGSKRFVVAAVHAREWVGWVGLYYGKLNCLTDGR